MRDQIGIIRNTRLRHLGLLVFCFVALFQIEIAQAEESPSGASPTEQQIYGVGTLTASSLSVRSDLKISNSTYVCSLSKRTSKEVNQFQILERSKNKDWYRVDLSENPLCRNACLNNSRCKENCSPDGACSAWIRSAFVRLQRAPKARTQGERTSSPANESSMSKNSESAFRGRDAEITSNKDTEADYCSDCESDKKSEGGIVKTVVDKVKAIVSEISHAVVSAFSKAKRVVKLMAEALRNRLSRSGGHCYKYVKNALLKSGLVSKYLPGVSPKNSGPELVKEGFVNLLSSDWPITSPCDAPLGSVLVYDSTNGNPHGHIEIKTENGYVSDFYNTNPRTGSCKSGMMGRGRKLIGVYIKPGAEKLTLNNNRDSDLYVRAQVNPRTQSFFEIIETTAKMTLQTLLPQAHADTSEPIQKFLNETAGKPPMSAEKMDEGYSLFEISVTKFLKDPEGQAEASPLLFQNIFELMFLLLEQDPSNYAMEVFRPLYLKLRAQTDAALKTKKPSDQKLFHDTFITVERELREGSG